MNKTEKQKQSIDKTTPPASVVDAFVMAQPNDENYEDDFNEFELCPDCDGHQACEDFGCAFKLGLGYMVQEFPL